jgi:hypothetical protein
MLLSISLSIAAAVQPSAPASDTITVTGRKPEEIRREAQAFVRAVGVASEPVARWVEPVCPEVVGVSEEIGLRVRNRVREVAERAGVRLGKAGCKGNLVIVFARQGETVVKQVAARSPDMLKDVVPAHRAYLYDGNSPIRWWHVTQARTKDGTRDIGNDVPPFVKLDGPGGPQLGGNVHTQYRSSIASTQMVRVLRAATVIVDVDDAEGKALDSVADFAALVGLAEIRPSDPPPAGSVLSLFAAGGPKELTPLDETFLRTLYKLPLDRTALAHRGLLVRGLVNGETKRAER